MARILRASGLSAERFLRTRKVQGGARRGGTRGPEVSVDHQSIYDASFKKYGKNWKEHLDEIAEYLQRKKVPVRKSWKQLSLKVHSWGRAASSIPDLMRKAVQRSIQYVHQHPESYHL